MVRSISEENNEKKLVITQAIFASIISICFVISLLFVPISGRYGLSISALYSYIEDKINNILINNSNINKPITMENSNNSYYLKVIINNRFSGNVNSTYELFEVNSNIDLHYFGNLEKNIEKSANYKIEIFVGTTDITQKFGTINNSKINIKLRLIFSKQKRYQYCNGYSYEPFISCIGSFYIELEKINNNYIILIYGYAEHIDVSINEFNKQIALSGNFFLIRISSTDLAFYKALISSSSVPLSVLESSNYLFYYSYYSNNNFKSNKYISHSVFVSLIERDISRAEYYRSVILFTDMLFYIILFGFYLNFIVQEINTREKIVNGKAINNKTLRPYFDSGFALLINFTLFIMALILNLAHYSNDLSIYVGLFILGTYSYIMFAITYIFYCFLYNMTIGLKPRIAGLLYILILLTIAVLFTNLFSPVISNNVSFGILSGKVTIYPLPIHLILFSIAILLVIVDKEFIKKIVKQFLDP